MGGFLDLFVIDRSGASRLPFGPSRPQLVIGRAYECDVRLGDPRASRAHAVLTRDAASGAVLLTDLGSKNGTTIGGRRLHPSMPVPLGEDVIVRIGDTLLVLEEQPPEARLTPIEGEAGFARQLDAEIERAEAEGGAFLLVEAPFREGPGAEPPLDDGDPSQRAETIFYGRLRERQAPVVAVERAFSGREVFLQVGEGVWRALVRDTPALEAGPLLARLRALLEDEGAAVGPLRSASFPEDGATAGALALALEASSHEGEPAPARPLSPALRQAAGLEVAIEHAASGSANALLIRTPGPSSPGGPSLSERRDEVAALAATFIVRACESMRRPDPPRLSPQALAVLEAYRWPGDLPELWVVIERAVVLCAGPCIRLEHLPIDRLCGSDARPPPRPEAPSETGLWQIARPPKAGWVC